MKYLIYILLAGFLLSCDQGANSKIGFRNNLGEYKNKKMHWGDPIRIEADGKKIDSALIFINGQRLDVEQFVLNKQNSALGSNKLGLRVYSEGEEKLKREVTFLVLPEGVTPIEKPRVRGVFAHNPQNFTQGFHYENGLIYEGTGLRGASKVEVYDLVSGKVLRSRKMANQYFGEGLTKIGDSLFQITYQSGKAFVYDANTLVQIKEFDYNFSQEGWGLCYDGKHLIMSNGSSYLYFIDPSDFSLHHRLQVVDYQGPRAKLNELEYHEGSIYANVWYSYDLLKINPTSGLVEAVIKLPEVPEGIGRENVANGIAFRDGRLLVTGKNWPTIYELDIAAQ